MSEGNSSTVDPALSSAIEIAATASYDDAERIIKSLAMVRGEIAANVEHLHQVLAPEGATVRHFLDTRSVAITAVLCAFEERRRELRPTKTAKPTDLGKRFRANAESKMRGGT